ncbi:MAG TPA: ribosome maturation factor RimM [Egibacteraceae bacterium]|nr:ribosome maturation factor RimM [Egibacteraceae bacterium]
MAAPEAVVVGVVGKPLGLKGEVYVRPDPDLAYDFAPGDRLTRDGDATLTVASSRVHANRQVVRFAGVEDREGAEALRGAVLTMPAEAVALDDDAFWTADLLGREVTDDHGDLIGVLEATLDGAAHDYLVIARPDGGEVLVPAVSDLVEVRDDAIVVHAIPGLLDDEGV